MQQSDSRKFVNGKPLSQPLGKNEKCRQVMAGGIGPPLDSGDVRLPFGVSGIGSTFDSDGPRLPFGQSLPPLHEPPVRFSFPASKDVEFDLRLAKQRLEKQSKQVLSWNEAFKMLVQKSDLATGKNAVTGARDAGQKRAGFCLKCRKKADIQNVQICDDCMKATTK